MVGEKLVRHLAVLLRQNGAGGVEQQPAGLHITPGVLQDRRLRHRQGEELVRLLVADLRLLADDAKPRAGGVHEDDVKGVFPLRAEGPPVQGRRLNGCQVKALRARLDPAELVLIEVAGHDPALVPHGHGAAEALAAGGGADVQHRFPAPKAHGLGDQGRRVVLDLEEPRLKGAELRQVSRAPELEAPRQQPRRHPDALRLQRGPQGLRRGQDRVGLDGDGRRGVVRPEEGLRLLPAQQGQQPPNQPLGMAVAGGKVRDSVPLRHRGQVFLVGGHLPEHGVHQARSLAPAAVPAELHGGIHRGAVRHPVQKDDLIGPQPQDVRQRLLQVVDLLRAVGPEIVVQQRPVLQHAVNQAGGQRRLLPREAAPPELRIQSRVRPGGGAVHLPQHPQGRGAGVVPFFPHLRPPRRSPPPRPRKMRRKRSSCRRDVRSAAT